MFRFVGILTSGLVLLSTTSCTAKEEKRAEEVPATIAAVAAEATDAAPLSAEKPASLSRPFFAQMVQQGVTFQVESQNDSSINQVTVRASGPTGPIGEIEAEADGAITTVEIGDLNADGFPEIYVFVTSAGSGSYGSLIAYASNRNKSLSAIYLPSLENDAALAKGYMGHDKFAVGEGAFVRRFPIYKAGDINAQPTGGTRQIQYKLEQGEAGWVLRQDRVIEY